jgi:hypothetical protein
MMVLNRGGEKVTTNHLLPERFLRTIDGPRKCTPSK